MAGYSLLLTVFSFTNFGLRAALGRELARLSASDDSRREMRDVVRTFEVVFWSLGAIVSLVVLLTSDWIARTWFVSQGIPTDQIARALRLMGVAMTFQFLYIFYEGGLVGLQRQFLTNGIWVGTGLLRGLGSVAVLWLVAPTPTAFLVWQVIVNAVQAATAGASLWRSLSGCAHRAVFRLDYLLRSWRFVAGNTLISINGVALTQVDKLAVSRMLPLESFGLYSIASLVSQVPTLIGGPIITAVIPNMTQACSADSEDKLARLYHRASQLLSVAIFPVALTLALFPRETLFFWTREAAVSDQTASLLSILVIAGAFQALQMMPMNLALSHGWTRLNVLTGVISTAIVVPLIVFFVGRYGAIGAATTWLALNAAILAMYPVVLHNRFLRMELSRWWGRDILAPLVGAAVPTVLVRLLINFELPTPLTGALVCAMAWALGTIMAVAMSDEARNEVMRLLRMRPARSRRD